MVGMADTYVPLLGYSIPIQDTPGADVASAQGRTNLEGSLVYYLPIYMMASAFTAIAWYNVIELNVLIYMTFKKKRGLYYWSLMISSWGCVLHGLGFILKWWLYGPIYLADAVITVGWYAMVTGQAFVLYSRLHLVVRNLKILNYVLAIIIIDACILHPPTTVMTFATSKATNPNYAQFVLAFSYIEKIQMTIFCLQEFFISSIYVFETLRLLKPAYNGKSRAVMLHLVYVNVFIVMMDIILLGVEYASLYTVEVCLKPFIYSIKLKLEFVVLNQLRLLARGGIAQGEREDSARQEANANRNMSLASFIDPNSDKGYRAMATKLPHPEWLSSVGPGAIVKTKDVDVRSQSKSSRDSPSEDQIEASDFADMHSPVPEPTNILFAQSTSNSQPEHASPQFRGPSFMASLDDRNAPSPTPSEVELCRYGTHGGTRSDLHAPEPERHAW